MINYSVFMDILRRVNDESAKVIAKTYLAEATNDDKTERAFQALMIGNLINEKFNEFFDTYEEPHKIMVGQDDDTDDGLGEALLNRPYHNIVVMMKQYSNEALIQMIDHSWFSLSTLVDLTQIIDGINTLFADMHNLLTEMEVDYSSDVTY